MWTCAREWMGGSDWVATVAVSRVELDSVGVGGWVQFGVQFRLVAELISVVFV